ncbi:hypothetical protein EGT74_13370 [Chitinophaga lutea]|uniref:Bacteriocin-protection protein n=1 Tax=Chitinophaga lutea TaxID=2488634 RepID=A0A3N4PKJ3_9BACT|nr:YdeI/OmpD-associated family protein [Chitinophaga lutea]RPE08058.1 hypothetical protein EGT74_13370 [Chitinophaga lutea]
METKNGLPVFHAATRAAWRKWLQKNSKTQKGAYLVLYHKNSGTPCVGYGESIEEALCFGWIDSKAIKRDDESFLLTFTERNPKSNWGKVAKIRAEKMISEGKMMPEGQAFIDLAKAKGTWDIFNDAHDNVIPPDLQKRFSKNKTALQHFEAFPPSAKRAVLEWILSAKRPETRERRIEEAVTLAAQNIRAAQPRKA